MTQYVSLLNLTTRAAGAVARARGVGFNGAQINAAGGKPLGIALTDGANGQDVTLAVSGAAICEAGAAITLGAAVAMDAQGRVVPATALAVASGGTAVTSAAANGATAITGGEPPQYVVGDALMAATAAGQFIEVLLRR
jgi:hypothetical protein